LFGHRCRLELLAELAEAGEQGVCVSELAVQRNVKSSVYYPPLRELESVGLVRKRREASRRRRILSLRPSPASTGRRERPGRSRGRSRQRGHSVGCGVAVQLASRLSASAAGLASSAV
jgi:DNA-binding transcriptional ArsR family regulator